jgi:hypothetical protein
MTSDGVAMLANALRREHSNGAPPAPHDVTCSAVFASDPTSFVHFACLGRLHLRVVRDEVVHIRALSAWVLAFVGFVDSICSLDDCT